MEGAPLRPYLPNTIKVGDCEEIRILYIYDPSKIWIVIKLKEFDELVELMKQFYQIDANRIPITKETTKFGLVCVVRKEGAYYRAVMVNLLETDLVFKIRLFLLDQGIFIVVDLNKLFVIDPQFIYAPRMSIRAELAKICPLDSRNFWSSTENLVFKSMIAEKTRLFAKICSIDHKRKILSITLREFCEHYPCRTINDRMVRFKIAKYLDDKRNERAKVKLWNNLQPKVKNLYLFPSFELLERGVVPSSLQHFHKLKTCTTSAVYRILCQYYLKEDENERK